MNTRDTYFSREHHYSLGIAQESGRHYLAIPVSNRLVDYEEYYGLSSQEYAGYMADREAAASFADECRERTHDDRLLLQPGWDRGIPMLPPPAGDAGPIT